MRADGGGPVRAPGGVLVERTRAPDALAGPMRLAVVDRPDAIAVPPPTRRLVNQVGGGTFEGVRVPGAVLSERLDGLPVAGQVQADQGLSDGVLLDVEYEARQPLGEALEPGVREGVGARGEQGLPVRPQLRSLHGHLPCWRRSAVLKVLTSSVRGVPSSIPRTPRPDLKCGPRSR